MIYIADKTTIHALKSMLYTLREYSDNEYCCDNEADSEFGQGLRLSDIEKHIERLESNGVSTGFTVTPEMVKAGQDAANGLLSESLVIEVFEDMLGEYKPCVISTLS